MKGILCSAVVQYVVGGGGADHLGNDSFLLIIKLDQYLKHLFYFYRKGMMVKRV